MARRNRKNSSYGKRKKRSKKLSKKRSFGKRSKRRSKKNKKRSKRRSKRRSFSKRKRKRRNSFGGGAMSCINNVCTMDDYFRYLDKRVSNNFELFDKDAKQVGQYLKNLPAMEALDFGEKYPNLSRYFAFQFKKGGITRKTLVNMKKSAKKLTGSSKEIVPSK